MPASTRLIRGQDHLAAASAGRRNGPPPASASSAVSDAPVFMVEIPTAVPLTVLGRRSARRVLGSTPRPGRRLLAGGLVLELDAAPSRRRTNSATATGRQGHRL